MAAEISDDLMEVLSELEKSTSDAVKAQRGSTRRMVHLRIWVSPGDRSRREDWKHEGTTADVSEQGCKLLISSPLIPGDFYYLSFDRDALDVPPTFARCMRSRMINEDAYEGGMKFLNPIDLSHCSDDSEESEDLI